MPIIEKVEKDHEKIIKDLEEELVRKQKLIDELRDQNKVLLKTALKNQSSRVTAEKKQ